MDRLAFFADENNLFNLKSLALEFSSLSERRILELYDLAGSFASAVLGQMSMGLSLFESLSMCVELPLSEDYPIHTNRLNENEGRIGLMLSLLRDEDRVIFASLLYDELRGLGVEISERDFLPQDISSEVVAYVRNALSDEAYDVLSQTMADPRVSYRTGLKECAAAVANGECGYALLPLEERGGVRLPTVSELLRKYDLKINAITPVFGPAADADLKYALVASHFCIPSISEDDDLYLELRIASSEVELTRILSACRLFGHALFRMNSTLVYEDGESIPYFNLVLRDNGRGGFGRLLLYLAIFSEDHVTEGIYKNLE